MKLKLIPLFLYILLSSCTPQNALGSFKEGTYFHASVGPYGPADFRKLALITILPDGQYCSNIYENHKESSVTGKVKAMGNRLSLHNSFFIIKENEEFLFNSEEKMNYNKLDKESIENCKNMINSNKAASVD
ncbi:hypothetical protein HYE60_00035 [Aggregatibacter actinomycetemcomitans]|uniref:hypothetical protein n=1 Tax=Aggregatibacter actinomycetemcomitans TaxID=714 RepID=UPI00197BF319|nr:hypothetical protein [Aggregatibacter actinomycetemcomitans]MBN6073681.1 hypothetical protein [Aggregatibacter actinomycetemcomitans]